MHHQFVDCRFDLLDPSRGRARYLESHIAGASFLDVDDDLSDMSRAPGAGRHPLPCAEAFARSGRADGTRRSRTTRIWGGAARLWWLLRLGHEGRDPEGGLRRGMARSGPGRRRSRRGRSSASVTAHDRRRGAHGRLASTDLRRRRLAPSRFQDEADDPIAALTRSPPYPWGGQYPACLGEGLRPRSEAQEIVCTCDRGHCLRRPARQRRWADARLTRAWMSERGAAFRRDGCGRRD
jgi:hypothetical protein